MIIKVKGIDINSRHKKITGLMNRAVVRTMTSIKGEEETITSH